MPQCDARMLTGGRCDLCMWHDGPHQKQYQYYVATWTDEDSRRSAVKYLSRFD